MLITKLPSNIVHYAFIAVFLLVIVGLNFYGSKNAVIRDNNTIWLLGSDSYYHYRQIKYSAYNPGTLQRYDKGTNFPKGQHSLSTGLYDLVTGSLIALFNKQASDYVILAVCATVPLFFAVVIYLSVYLFTQQIAGTNYAFLSVILLLFFPGPLKDKLLFGNADHHAVEVSLGLLSIFSFYLINCTHRKLWQVILATTPLLALLFTWVGVPIYFFIVAVILVCLSMICSKRQLNTIVTYTFSLAVLSLVLAFFKPELIIQQKIYIFFVLGSLFLALLCPILNRLYLYNKYIAVLTPVFVTIVLFVLVYLFLPNGRELLNELIGAKTPYVAEHVKWSWQYFLTHFGGLGVFSLLGLLWILLKGAGDTQAKIFLSVPLIGLVFFSLRTNDYQYAISPYLVLIFVYLLKQVFVIRYKKLATALVVLLAIQQAYSHLYPFSVLAVARPWSSSDRVEQMLIVNSGLIEANDWIKNQAPVYSDYRYPEDIYGVLTSWDQGSIFAALSAKPVVSSQGLTDFVDQWFLETDEVLALQKLTRVSNANQTVKYVVVDTELVSDYMQAKLLAAGKNPQDYQRELGSVNVGGKLVALSGFGKAYSSTMAARLYYKDPELKHFRLVFESKHESLIYHSVQLNSLEQFRLQSLELNDPQRAQWAKSLIKQGVKLKDQVLYYAPRIEKTVKVYQVIR